MPQMFIEVRTNAQKLHLLLISLKQINTIIFPQVFKEINIINRVHIILKYSKQNISPYGLGEATNSPIIALGIDWAYHMGHFLADQRYAHRSAQANEQGIGYLNNNSVALLSSHLNLLEDFDPSRTGDPFRWIPKGLMYDLMDARNELGPHPVVDGVSNFTVAQLFNALQSNVTTLQQYRVMLQQQNSGNQTIPITNLFAQYGY